jgi:hypothetical protein
LIKINNNVIKLVISALPILLLFAVLEFISGIIIQNQYSDTKVISQIYVEYFDKLNHLRDLNFDKRLPKKYINSDSLIYNRIPVLKKEQEAEVLIQGDSWAESFLTNALSRNIFEEAADKYGKNFVIAGTSSYSPSLMSAQLRILNKDFGIFPEKIIAFIDQTDIGDELCRYKDYRYMENGGIFVRSFDSERNSDPYFIEPYMRKVKILSSQNLNLVKILKIAVTKINRTPQPVVCGWTEIEKYLLYGLTEFEAIYLMSTFSQYVETVFQLNSVEKLIIVTFPHKRHLTGEYKYDVSELVSLVVNQSPYRKKIKFISSNDMKKEILTSGIPIDNIYYLDDPASHLTEKAHAKILTHYIVNITNML